MYRAEQKISDAFASYVSETHEGWRGHEKQLVIELVRSLDQAAFFTKLVPSTSEDTQGDVARHYMRLGAAFALRPLLEIIEHDPHGVPWAPTSPELANVADQHLHNCGIFAGLKRLAGFERYGLARATFCSDDHLVIEVASDEEDRSDVEAGHWLRGLALAPLLETSRRLACMKEAIGVRIDRHVAVDRGWFIRYDTDDELITYHRELAETQCAGIAEMSALPGDAPLGGRRFSDWNRASVEACRRILHHVAFSTRLRATTPQLDLRNLITIFARKEDVHAVWRESGESEGWAKRIVAGLTLDVQAAAQCERDFEIPLPYHIDFGKHFYLLPVFGGLGNPGAGLIWHLRRHYRDDWDRAVDRREDIFREDLRSIFPADTYEIPSRGFKLRRQDGSVLTDIDAVIVEKQSGMLAILQLKWLDVHGRSPAERNSRRSNFLKANEWVKRVWDWIAGRSASEIAKALGLEAAGNQPPLLLVIARHAASFSGEQGKDPRASWISWPKLVQMQTEFPADDLRTLLKRTRPQSSPRSDGKKDTSFRLPNMIVEVKEI